MASRSGFTFNDFLVNLAPIVVVLLVVFILVCRVLFRRDFEADPDQVAEVMELTEREAIRDGRLLRRSLVVLAPVLAAFSLHPVLHLEPSVVALLGAGVLVGISGLDAQTYLADIEWETLLFFSGLFILVGSLVKTGAVDHLATGLAAAIGDSPVRGMMLLLWGSAVLSAAVDNIPYVATMAPVVQQLTAEGRWPARTGCGGRCCWAPTWAATRRPSAPAPTSSSPGIAKRNGHPISFWEFTKYGSVVAVGDAGDRDAVRAAALLRRCRRPEVRCPGP